MRALAVLGTLAVVLQGCVVGPEPGTVIPIGGPTDPPIGWIAYCARNINSPECLALTAGRWRDLVLVNFDVNSTVRQRPDTLENSHGVLDYWTAAVDEGDCEDIALAKRQRLIARGWPQVSLRLAMAQLPDGQYHVVLVALTGEGSYVLDNLRPEIVSWDRLPGYRWLKIQSTSALEWRTIDAAQLAARVP